jgi:hypothetical protein
LWTVEKPPGELVFGEMLQPPTSAGAARAKKRERAARGIMEGTPESLRAVSFTARAVTAIAALVSRDSYRFIVSSRGKGGIPPDASVVVVDARSRCRATGTH